MKELKHGKREEILRRRSHLSESKQRLIERRLRGEGPGNSSLRIIPRREQGISIPLSYAQQRLWFLDQLMPEKWVYNIATAFSFSEQISVGLLQQSLDEVVRRHEVLRTIFAEIDGEPIQSISYNSYLKLPVIDLAELAQEERQAEVLRLAIEQITQPFDLRKGPLFRNVLLRSGESEYAMVLVMHHIVSDGWSLGLFIHELATIYESFSRRIPFGLPELPIQYADFAVWQRELLSGDLLTEQLTYWRRQLEEDLPPLTLPTVHLRPPVQTFHGRTISISLSENISDRLRSQSGQQDATLFMILLAVFKALLHRYSSEVKITIGTPITGRTLVETERLIGLFVNMLVLRTDLSGNPTFAELLGRVRKTALEAYAHSDLPFERLVEELQPERNLSHHPLFQIAFIYNDAPRLVARNGSFSAEPIKLDVGGAQFDLTLMITNTTTGLSGGLEYNTDLFDQQTAARLADGFSRILQAVVSQPDLRLADLPVLTDAERRQLLFAWNDTRTPPAPLAAVHQLFEAGADRWPESIAVYCDGFSVSYAELEAKANHLARVLIETGVGAEARVGVCLRRSVEMVIAMLGILKSGGAYVPLDANLPAARIAHMTKGVEVALTDSASGARLEGYSGRRLFIDEWRTEAAARQAGRVGVSVESESLAYVIYTSGSTGEPKGVGVSHGAVVNLLKAMEERPGLGREDRLVAVTSLSFDIAGLELLLPLIVGAELIVADDEQRGNGVELRELIRRGGGTAMQATPSTYQMLLGSGVGEMLRGMKLLCGGEVLSEELARRLKEEGEELWDMYGPTETTIWSSAAEVVSESGSRSVSIGRPIANTQMYIVDGRDEVTPVGVSGELRIGGAGLARGYVNEPALTAEKFVPDSYSGEAGDRVYRTGDEVRYLADGRISYLGRRDQQVKVRGYRIELGEVEAAVREQAGVSEAVVVVRGSGEQQQLVCYVVMEEGREVSGQELREELKRRLPEYMAPGRYVRLEKMPLTPSGKIDRRALPLPGPTRSHLSKEFIAPRTPIEQLLAGIWAQVLGVEQIGADDNFFELGGDSIRSIEIRAKARQIGLDFSVQQLFQHQTIFELGRLLNLQRLEKGVSWTRYEPFSLVSHADRQMLPEDVEDAYPLVALQIGMLFHSEFNAENAVYHNVSSFHLRAPFDREKLQTSLQQVAARHAMLRTSFDLSHYSEPLQLVHRRVSTPLRVDDINHLSVAEQEEKIDAWMASEQRRKFDWQRAPLVRFYVHRRSDETFQFSWIHHHAILDGWSAASLLTELFNIYFHQVSGEPSFIDPAPVASYGEFVSQERQAISSNECQEFWVNKLKGSVVSVLPRWTESAGAGATEETRSREITIADEISAGLKKLSQSAGVPLKSVLLAAHLRVLSLLSGRSDVVTGLVSNTRIEQVDGERVLGLFLNTLPLRLDLSGGRWLDLAREVFKVETDILQFRRFPLANLQRVTGGRDLFETTFDFVNFHIFDRLMNLEGIQVLDHKGSMKTNFTFDASFSMNSRSSRIGLTLDYDASQFCDAQIERILSYYTGALHAMASSPDQRYESLSLLSEEEKEQLIIEWNATHRNYANELCVSRLFESRVERIPDAIAVMFDAEQVTYGALNQRANQVARLLRRKSVGPEQTVAVCVERGVEMIIGAMAVLKAGAAYVPLDPSYPIHRLSFMLEDSRAAVILTQRRLASDLSHLRSDIISLDSDAFAQVETGDLPDCALIDNLAYIIYTSGSTQNPRGAFITHSGLANVYFAWNEDYSLESKICRHLQMANFVFDVATDDMVRALCSGAKLVICPSERLLDGERLCELILREGIDCADFVPVVARNLIDHLERSGRSLEFMRLFIIGSEIVYVDDYERVKRFCGEHTRVINAYGLTECTIDSSYFESKKDELLPMQYAPIGRPIANTQMYIVDGRDEVTPVGVSGELRIGGAGLARGYVNEPALTAEKFVPDSYSEAVGERVYRTGDEVRYLADGRISYLGRRDQQVKVRGYRIELGEVEAAVREQAGVSEAVVVVRGNGEQQQLVCYVVVEEGRELSGRELREELKRRLPEYMAPGRYVRLEKMPLTPSGKIDRRALPEAHGIRFQTGTQYVMPKSEAERVICAAWQEILSVERVGREDNFFDLGGHSLLLIKVHDILQSDFGKKISIIDLFKYPTVSALAGFLSSSPETALSFQQPIERARTRNDAVNKGANLRKIRRTQRQQEGDCNE